MFSLLSNDNLAHILPVMNTSMFFYAEIFIFKQPLKHNITVKAYVSKRSSY